MSRRRRILVRSAVGLGLATVAGLLLAGGGLLYVLMTYGKELPDYRQLADYEPPVLTRIYAGDGSVLREYARERRLFLPIETVPNRVVHAFLSAEDKNFYDHPGIDPVGIARAAVKNVGNVLTGARLEGASTITQQVAKNFLLTSEVSIERKIQEAILSFRIERAFSKDRILELYLNEILFGRGSYGLAAAALNYFDKAVDELTLAEAAYLAALPKAPYNYHPTRRTEAAIARRDWVLERMHANGYIDQEAMESAQAQPLGVRERTQTEPFRADHFEEEVRRRLAKRFGTDKLYEGGLEVRTTLEPRLQAIAETALREGLIEYDRRHGWRGPLTVRSTEGDWAGRLSKVPRDLGMDDWRIALVHDVRESGAVIGFEDGGFGFVPFETMKWARPHISGQRFGQPPEDPGEVLEIGDVVPVEPMPETEKSIALETFFDAEGNPIGAVESFALRQVPDIEGALTVLDPHTGRVLAMVGGYNFAESQFNRAVQAERQPGSAFKPFVYAAALEEGFTPSTLVLDAPFVIDQGQGQGKWKPRNYSDKFYGPSTLRLGLEKSRNLMTVRVAQYIGMDNVVDMAKRFGLGEDMKSTLAHALGAGETSVLDLTAAYAMLANGGKEIEPTLIDRVQDRYGETVFKHDDRPCPGCAAEEWEGQAPPQIPDTRDQVLDPRLAYQVVHMLEGVVERGTGRRLKSLNRPLAGKTGTTNESQDAWFIGFTPDLVVTAYVGFDRPKTLGPAEQGATAAAPIVKDVLAGALEGEPAVPFRIPEGLRLVRVNAETGLPAVPGDDEVLLEAFIPGTEPIPGEMAVLDVAGFLGSEDSLRKGTGGLY